MNKVEVRAKFLKIKQDYYKSGNHNPQVLGGKISGLKRKEYKKMRLPILKEIFEQINIEPTLNICKYIDESVFGTSSHFKDYKIYFKNLDSNRTEHIFEKEIQKFKIYTRKKDKYTTNENTYQLGKREKYNELKEDFDTYFDSLKNGNDVITRVKGDRYTTQKEVEDICENNPEYLL